MKPVYKCDYCSHMGTEEEVKEHELNCRDNHDRRSCYTCKYRGKLSMENELIKYECEKGLEIPAGKIIEFCNGYDRKEKGPYSDLVSSLFGGFKL